MPRVSSKNNINNSKSGAEKQSGKGTHIKRVRKKTVKRSPRSSTRRAGQVPIVSKVTTKTYSTKKSFKERISGVLNRYSDTQDSTTVSQSRAANLPARSGFISVALIKYEPGVIRAARVTGTVFVVVGAVLSFVILDRIAVYSHTQLLAETITSSPTTSESETELNAGTSIDETPDVVFDIPLGSAVNGMLDITMRVPYAERIVVKLFYKDGQHYSTLGDAKLAADNLWKRSWDTSKFQDGEYRVIAIVHNQFGSYEDRTDGYVLVENHPASNEVTEEGYSEEPAGEQDASVETANDPSVGLETVVEPPVEINVSEEDPLDGDVDFSFFVDGALSVKVLYRSVGTGAYTTLGFASQRSDREWRYRWRTENVHNGEYEVRLLVQNAHGTYDTDPVRYRVDNVANDEKSVSPEFDGGEGVSEVYELPRAALTVIGARPLSGMGALVTEVKDASFVEVYVRSSQSATPRFLGLARKTAAGSWRYDWDTTKTPNGDYVVFARAKTPYGLVDTNGANVSIKNVVTTTATIITDVQKIETQITRVMDGQELLTDTSDTLINTHGDVVDTTGTASDEVEMRVAALTDELFKRFSNELDAELTRLSSALRANDEVAIQRGRDRLSELRLHIIRSALNDGDSDDLIALIDRRITGIIERLRENTEKTEMIIRERIGDEISRDSDGDGITDYDEVTIYNTDPASADSDGDGFHDGAEILNGYDPLESAAEVSVRYESPRESGIVREEIVRIDAVTTVTPDRADEGTDGVKPQALITGKGLPNSFVTLYIFSTPIIVTVKTDEDGSWSYTFDKELEDGEHEVYVGVTDNAGRIIAKSNPFRFVKEAQAFTPVDAAAGGSISPPQSPEEPSVLSDNLILLVLSLSIVAIGLVLLLLGLHLHNRSVSEEKPVHA